MRQRKVLKNNRDVNIRCNAFIKIKNSTDGITLIALVITIIVLLILAGVSIATLTGENGILNQADKTKEETRGASVQEARDLWKINQEADNQTENATTQTLDELINDLVNQKLLTEDERNQILGNVDKGIKATYQVTIGSRKIVFKTIETLAGDVLKTDSTATDAETRSPFVKYNGLDCRVLYNDDIHGLQIITSENVESEVTFGADDNNTTLSEFVYDGPMSPDYRFLRSASSYNDAKTNLYHKAISYVYWDGIAKDARCLGSASVLTSNLQFQNVTSEMLTGTYEYLKTYGWDNKFKSSDTNYIDDVNQLNALGLNVKSGYTWLASYFVDSSPDATSFHLRMIDSDGCLQNYYLCHVNNDGSSDFGSGTAGFRPIFLIESDVVISKGNGSSEDPYVIGE